MNATINEPIAPEIIQAIIAQATALGLSVNDFLRQSLGLTNGAHVSERPFYETATREEWKQEFNKWADSHNPNTPALTLEAVSRESIYSDSDD